MEKEDFYSIILPTYNEAENLPLIIYLINKYFSQIGEQFEVIVVDDNSRDGTQDVCKQLQEVFGDEKIKLRPRKGKLGLGTAYFHGYESSKGNYVFLMDADLSHHPKYIPQMIEKQRKGKFDFVTGTRYAGDGGVYGWNTFRKFTSKCANYIAQTLLNPGVSDLTGSFRLYKREVFQKIYEVRKSLPKGYAFQMAIAVRLKDMGLTCGEVPIHFVDRLYGESKLSTKEITGFAFGVLKLWVE